MGVSRPEPSAPSVLQPDRYQVATAALAQPTTPLAAASTLTQQDLCLAGTPLTNDTFICPGNGTSCYQYHTTNQVRSVANTNCRAAGGTLVAWNTYAEQLAVEMHFNKSGISIGLETYWTGLERLGNLHYWPDGTSIGNGVPSDTNPYGEEVAMQAQPLDALRCVMCLLLSAWSPAARWHVQMPAEPPT